ncbi:YjgB family protein [Paenibacillus andongensis]|uniref:YjgB family protein n=1 Tax=Paenibacillus andongensis TaxID=2975482 RepID=UPI0021BB7CB2|nr:YjgB family protein [Paenibacillus andongensis]
MKNVSKKASVYPMLIASMLMFTACTSTEKPAASAAAPIASNTPSSVVEPSSTPSSAPSSAPTTSSKPASTSSGNINVIPISSETTSVSKQIKDMLELAKLGKVAGIEFAAETKFFEDVEKAWGNADHKEAVGSGIYATYTKKNAVIGFNKGDQIIDIRSSDPKLQSLTLNQIEQALGKPVDTKVNGDDMIYIYKASDEFQLKFIIPKSSGKVDHISVFDTKHSVNNMAG